jgi:glutathione S-transferase
MSADAEDYGGNPALKLPTLRTDGGAWFGSLNICRELARQSSIGLDILWPEDLGSSLHANAQELTLQAMATEVGLIMGKANGIAADNALQAKQRASLLGTIASSARVTAFCFDF